MKSLLISHSKRTPSFSTAHTAHPVTHLTPTENRKPLFNIDAYLPLLDSFALHFLHTPYFTRRRLMPPFIPHVFSSPTQSAKEHETDLFPFSFLQVLGNPRLSSRGQWGGRAQRPTRSQCWGSGAGRERWTRRKSLNQHGLRTVEDTIRGGERVLRSGLVAKTELAWNVQVAEQSNTSASCELEGESRTKHECD
jgi:hypothetical protein